jgi:hypothetical protein
LSPSQHAGFKLLWQHAAPSQHFPSSQQLEPSQQAAVPWQHEAAGIGLCPKAVIAKASESTDKVDRMRFMNFS